MLVSLPFVKQLWFKVLRKQEGMWSYGQRFLMGQVSDNFQDLQVFHLE